MSQMGTIDYLVVIFIWKPTLESGCNQVIRWLTDIYSLEPFTAKWTDCNSSPSFHTVPWALPEADTLIHKGAAKVQRESQMMKEGGKHERREKRWQLEVMREGKGIKLRVGGRDGRENCLTAAWSCATPKFRHFKDTLSELNWAGRGKCSGRLETKI